MTPGTIGFPGKWPFTKKLSFLTFTIALAENNLSIAINLDPDYVLAYENLILLNIKKNNLFLAKKYLNQLLNIDSNNIKAKELLKSLNWKRIRKRVNLL